MAMAIPNDTYVTHDELNKLKVDLNQFFLVTCGMIVWFMAPGFALLEAGMVQARNTVNVFARNIADQLTGILVFWLVGFGLAFGMGNAFCGTDSFALKDTLHATYAFWFLQYTYAATPASIVQGAVTERVSYVASIVQTFVLLGFTYPIVVHWAWADQGWLNVGFVSDTNHTITYQDYAGSGVVHATGGAAALIAAILVGPRIERVVEGSRRLQPAPPPHNISLMAMGALILHFGFLAFNAASHYKITGDNDGDYVSHSIVNTVIAFGSSAFAGLLVNKLINRDKWAFSSTINASLTGMVSICASCNQLEPWAAFVIGFVAALVYLIISWITPRVGIDDPLDAIAVHYGGGSWGVLSTGLFANTCGVFINWNLPSLYTFLWQLTGIVAISVWTIAVTGLVFGVLRILKLHRVPEEWEVNGIDGPVHGEWAYPSDAYGCSWVTDSGTASLGVVLRQRQTYSAIPTNTSDFQYRPIS